MYTLSQKYPEAEIYMMDHISQGLSERWSEYQMRGWTRDFQNYVKDLDYFVKQVRRCPAVARSRALSL